MTVAGGTTDQGRRLILKTHVPVRHREETLREISNAVDGGTPLRVAFVNAHLATLAARSSAVEEALSGFLLLNDGVGIDLASLILFGRRFPANLNGTDLLPVLLDRLKPGTRVYLLGATARVIADAAAVYGKLWPQLLIVGHHHGYLSADEETAVAEMVRATRPDLVLVGMGCPRQEAWISRNVPAVCPVGIGVGALFDFQTGAIRRAPPAVRKLRLEWAYRLLGEPRRLSGRYLLGGAAFVAAVVRQRATRSGL